MWWGGRKDPAGDASELSCYLGSQRSRPSLELHIPCLRNALLRMQVGFWARTVNPLPTWPQGKAGFRAALCARSHRVKGWGTQDSLSPRRCSPCSRSQGRPIHHSLPAPQHPGQLGCALLLWSSYCTKAKSAGLQSPGPSSSSSPTLPCCRVLPIYRTAKRLIFSFLPSLPSPIPLWLYRLVSWRAGRERGEERMGRCSLYVSGCWGWLWRVCTQRCLCAQGPVLHGAASHSWLWRWRKLIPVLARQGMEWLKGKKLLCFEEVTLVYWKKNSLAQEPSLPLSYAISCSC